MFTVFLFLFSEADGSNGAKLNRRVAMSARAPLSEAGATPAERTWTAAGKEFERLAQRALSSAEGQALREALVLPDPPGARSADLWVEGLRPEALPTLAASIASGGGRQVVFLSPHGHLLSLRQHRLAPRLALPVQIFPWQSAPGYGKSEPARGNTAGTDAGRSGPLDAPSLTWLSIGQFASEPEIALRFGRFLGSLTRPLLFIEDAHGFGRSSYAIRPALDRLVLHLRSLPHQPQLVFGSARGQSEARHRYAQELARPLAQRILEATPAVFLRTFEPEEGQDRARTPQLREARRPKPSLDAAPPATPAAVEAAALEQGSLSALIAKLPRPSVLLCDAPADADTLYSQLSAEQVPCHRYHAGMSRSQRAEELVRFLLPGRRAVLITTSGYGADSGLLGDQDVIPEAFGVGYGRGDLRSIVHLAAPRSLSQLAQELALLHRGPHEPARLELADEEEQEEELESADGMQATRSDTPIAASPQTARYATLVVTSTSLEMARATLERRRPLPEDVLALTRTLLANASGTAHADADLLRQAQLGPRRGAVIIALLLDTGILRRTPEGLVVTGTAEALRSTEEQLIERLELLRSGDAERLEGVQHFLRSTECRPLALARLLGEGHADQPDCGNCDRCLSAQELTPPTHAPSQAQGMPASSTALARTLPALDARATAQARAGRRRSPARADGARSDSARSDSARTAAADFCGEPTPRETSTSLGTKAEAAGESGRSRRKISPRLR